MAQGKALISIHSCNQYFMKNCVTSLEVNSYTNDLSVILIGVALWKESTQSARAENQTQTLPCGRQPCSPLSHATPFKTSFYVLFKKLLYSRPRPYAQTSASGPLPVSRHQAGFYSHHAKPNICIPLFVYKFI